MRRGLTALAAIAWPFLLSTPCFSQEQAKRPVPSSPSPVAALVTRGYVDESVPASGIVTPNDIYRLKSTIEGRMETVMVSSYSWAPANKPLGLLSTIELAALIDSRGTTSQDMLEDRWQREYRPVKVLCGSECFVLQVYIHDKRPVRPEQVLFDVARQLLLIAHVGPADADRVRKGMPIEAWPQGNRSRTIQAYVSRVTRDDRGGGVTVEAAMSPAAYLEPGVKFDGRVILAVHKDSLRVPNQALIKYQGATYLPILVRTGLVGETQTEILDDVGDNRPVLILNPEDLHGAEQGTRGNLMPPPPTRPQAESEPESDQSQGRNEPLLDPSKTDQPDSDNDTPSDQ